MRLPALPALPARLRSLRLPGLPRNKWVRLVLLLLGLGSLPPVTMLIALLSVQRPGVLAGMIQSGLGPGFAGKITMGEVMFDPPMNLTIKDPQVCLPPVLDTPLLKATCLTFQPHVVDMLFGQPGASDLKLLELQVKIVRRPDGGINLPGLGQLALLLSGPDRPRLTAALSDPDESLSIDSFSVEGGSLLFQDQVTDGQFTIDKMTVQGRFDSGVLRLGALEGQAFEKSPISLTGRVRQKPPSSAELHMNVGNLPLGRLAPWLLPPPQRKRGDVLTGDVSGDAALTALSGGVKVVGHLGCPALGFDDSVVTQAKWIAYELGGDFEFKQNPKSGRDLLWRFQARGIQMSRGTSDTTLYLDSPKGELELQGSSLALRLTEGRLGPGTVTAGGVLDGENWNLVVQGQAIDLGMLLNALGQEALARKLDNPTLESAEVRFSSEGLEISRCKLQTGRGLTFEGGGLVQQSPSGPRLVRASGQVEVGAAVLAELTGFALPENVEGPLSVELTAGTTQFTALVRSTEVALGMQPRFQIKGLAAAVSGVLAELGGHSVSGWSANVRASRFTVVWDALLKGLGFPENWPLAMNTGSATVVRDLQGLHVREFRCQGSRGEGSGDVDLSPQGQLSGKLKMLLSLKGSLEATSVTRILSGTLDEPVIRSE